MVGFRDFLPTIVSSKFSQPTILFLIHVYRLEVLECIKVQERCCTRPFFPGWVYDVERIPPE